MQGAPAVALSPAVGRWRPADRGTPQAALLPRRSRRSYLRAKRSARPPGLQVLLLGPATSPSQTFISAPFPPPAQRCAPPPDRPPLSAGAPALSCLAEPRVAAPGSQAPCRTGGGPGIRPEPDPPNLPALNRPLRLWTLHSLPCSSSVSSLAARQLPPPSGWLPQALWEAG